MRFRYISNMRKTIDNADVVRGPNGDLSILYPLLVYVSNKCSGKSAHVSAHMRRLALAFVAQIMR